MPVLYLGILCFLVKLQPIRKYAAITQSYEVRQNVLSSLLQTPIYTETSSNTVRLEIVPDNNVTRQITKQMSSVWQSYSYDRLRNKNVYTFGRQAPELIYTFHNSESDLIEFYADSSANWSMAVILPSDLNMSSNYTIRLSPDWLFTLPSISDLKIGLQTCRAGPDSNESSILSRMEFPFTCPVNGYYYANFLALQSLVDQALLQIRSGKNVNLTITIENYPAAEYSEGLSTLLRILIPLYTVVPLAQLINNLLVMIVTEKEKKIKDGLRMIGVSDLAYWLSWFGVYSIIVFIYAVLFTLVLYFMSVLRNFNPVILFLIFLLFGFSVITFAFSLTPFFHKPKTAGIVGTLIMQFTSLLFLLQTFLVSSNNIWMSLLKLFSSLAFTTAIDEACQYEYSGGIGWSDLFSGGRGLAITNSMLFLVFDTILYAVMAVYLDSVIPNEFGVKKSPIFFFKPSYWNGSRSSREYQQNGSTNVIEEDSFDDFAMQETENMEGIPASLIGKEAIRVRHIKKTYYTSCFGSKSVEAVKGISMNIYEGQITALLGKNGAGKSTLFNMLIGLVSPTSGTSRVFGYDITDPHDMSKLRKITGICLQFDLHFEALTVEEHMEFYGKLRGLRDGRLKSEIELILSDLKLTEMRNVRALNLSGGQKRKLSVGLSLIGDPKIILLDEPSASMDPLSRRHLWSLLQSRKEGKVILLTTHFMDEADILADRKAIIHEGHLKCVGSSLFLKNRFGIGYYLTIELVDRHTPTTICDDLIKKWIPSALNSRKYIANEVKFSLPHSEMANFPSLFADFEEHIAGNKGIIRSYGVSMTTLEEVFLKLSSDADALLVPPPSSQQQPTSHLESGEHGGNDEQNLIEEVLHPDRTHVSIVLAMCRLRTLRLIRNPYALFFMFLMPVILVAIGLGIFKAQKIPTAGAILDFNNFDDVYKRSELNIALYDINSRGLMKRFLEENGATVFPYNGTFENILSINQPIGTMAAIRNPTVTNNAHFTAHVIINGTFLHSPPLITSLITRYFEQEVLHSTTPHLSVISKPFPTKFPRAFDALAFYAVFMLGPAFIFAGIGMVMEIVYDREIKAKNHLRLNGLSFGNYYASMFIIYGILSFLVTLLQLSLIWMFNIQSFTNVYAFTVTSFLLMLFIVPSLLFGAFFSYVFDKMETAQSVYSQIASWSGTIISIIIIILDAVNINRSVLMITHTVFSALDIFYIPFAIFYFVNKQYLACNFTKTCDELSWSNYMGTEFIVMFIAMVVQIPVFLFLLRLADLMKDGGKLRDILNMFLKRKRVVGVEHIPEDLEPSRNILGVGPDEDVLKEQERVVNIFSGRYSPSSLCVLAVKDLVKSYSVKVKEGRKKLKKRERVVNGVNFLVEEGEVFGLLGHNGAGKTTVMKMITAEESPDHGSIQLCGYDISSNMSEAFLKLGYCPQEDVLWENITLKEHIELYSTIRGIKKDQRRRLVDNFLNGLKIQEHSNKKARELSGGTKRKLSYAMSMLGSPKVVFLDEPSTGMDPQSKRFLWNTVLGTFKDSRGALLTTHSMEEADVLCSRIAIMVKGSIICIGSPQHLKTKYGSGFTLEVKLKTPEIARPASGSLFLEENIDADVSQTHGNFTFTYIKDHFPESRLTESFGNRAIFSVPQRSVKSISKTFSLLEQLKEQQDIEEYSFSQTTLEQVFLSFARETDEQDEE